MKLDVLLNEDGEKTNGAVPGPELKGEPGHGAIEIRSAFGDIAAVVDRIVAEVEALEITDDDRQNYAVGVTGEIKKALKQFDARRRDITADADGFIKSVRGYCSQFTDRLEAAARTIQGKLQAYRQNVELERRKQEALAKKAAQDLQKKLDAQAKKAGVEAPEVPVPIIPQQKTAVRTESGTTAYEVKRWICTVKDPAAVPREYCEPSRRLLDEAVKMGTREIPGCVIEEVTDIRFRT